MTVTQCPVRSLPSYAGLLWGWRLYQQGHLPLSGGSLEQPAIIMDAFALISKEAQWFAPKGVSHE